MLCGGVAACHGYSVCNARCVECDCVVCVMLAVFSATQHSEHYTRQTHDMLPHHHITYNDVVFTGS